jgi:hypothetical protein
MLDQWKEDDEVMYEMRKRRLRLILASRLADPQFVHHHTMLKQLRDVLDARDHRQSFLSFSDNIQTLCQRDGVYADHVRIATAWLDKVNQERRSVGAPPLLLDPRLNQTA